MDLLKAASPYILAAAEGRVKSKIIGYLEAIYDRIFGPPALPPSPLLPGVK
jgi:hypothetical protein